METVIASLVTSPWLYLVLVLLILSDVYVPVLPSGTTLVLATVYAVTSGETVVPLLVTAAAASTLGDLLAFRLARSGATRVDRLLARSGRLSGADHRLRAMLRRSGARTVLVARFVPAGRCLVVNTGGREPGIRFGDFARWSATAAVCWAAYTVGIGFLNAVVFHTGWLAGAVSVVCLLALGAWFARTGTAEAVRASR
ncbi:membrane protein DedA with SNARE-associated domain [Stackebrandtia albiflava]|uniref:Membrane protein DedA with SNARE-associated domain n=1 Tax=Stackebrandtia albiflava TaxID=406432 RepID=A0A562ULN8_9ACTN|nr:VTT domain-containing protein [Stackebrandtia albiflava]TWJ06522.1 membrane protein DedA with SNARE-associated domain [Stackebrandtia albiflava]